MHDDNNRIKFHWKVSHYLCQFYITRNFSRHFIVGTRNNKYDLKLLIILKITKLRILTLTDIE